MITVGFVMLIIMITLARVLFTQNITPQSPSDMMVQFEPIAGPFSMYLFGFGVFAAGFSSIVINALLGSTLLSDGIGIGNLMSSKNVKLIGIGICLIGFLTSVVPNLLGSNTIHTVIVAQIVTIVALPFNGWLAIKFSNDSSIRNVDGYFGLCLRPVYIRLLYY